ncbi:hypothetical protein C0Z17_14160 [Trinickia caryophylli]|nr:hypothetical protein C0Z17_14160 [Trinickia caryophylli]
MIETPVPHADTAITPLQGRDRGAPARRIAVRTRTKSRHTARRARFGRSPALDQAADAFSDRLDRSG